MSNDQNDRDQSGPLKHRLDRLLESVRALGGAGEHRRDELVERAEEQGLDRPAAEQAYDLAREEKLEPAYGLALVLRGVSVQPLSGRRPDVQTSAATEPEWVDTPPSPELADRERRLRQTFRRFRSALEEGGPEGAVRAFRDAPDVEPWDFGR